MNRYVLYESINDMCVDLRGLKHNTKILGVFDSEERALEQFKFTLNSTIQENSLDYDWYSKSIDLDILEDNNIIRAMSIINGGIDEEQGEEYLLILEKIEEEIEK